MQTRRGWKRGEKGWNGRSNVRYAGEARRRPFVRKVLDYVATGQPDITEASENGGTGVPRRTDPSARRRSQARGEGLIGDEAGG